MAPDAATTEPAPPAPSAVQPPRPSAEEVAVELAAHVEALAGPGSVPRPEQVAAVQAVVAEGRRTLLVARTGFGKSAVYFSATRMLRDRGWGPTVVVSPLLALMRDQVAAARKLGLVAETLNSSNLDDWDAIEAAIADDRVDLLLVSPERLANAGFRERVFRLLLERPMALVCDEAHCISDWGHDFRPDYLRLRRLLAELPSWTPVLATTATANQRVTDDVASQLGEGTFVLRTSLDRESLHLSVVQLDHDAQRLAWLASAMQRLEGSGIVYCLTVDQAERTAEWLRLHGVACAAYSGQTDPAERELLEDRLRANDLKALIATSALGMGFDKGDLAFTIHLGLPPTPVAYYQQVGRAGRGIDRAEVIALPRPEQDPAVWRWFESVALPPESTCLEVLDQLSSSRPTSTVALEARVNLGRSRLATLLKILEVQGAVVRAGNGWRRTTEPWSYDTAKAERLSRLRRDEADQMAAYTDIKGCRLGYLREALDDPEAVDCGRCDRCTETGWNVEVEPALVDEAARFLRGSDLAIEPRKQWPSGLDEPKGRIAAERQARRGRALCRPGDGGWAPLVTQLIGTDDASDAPAGASGWGGASGSGQSDAPAGAQTAGGVAGSGAPAGASALGSADGASRGSDAPAGASGSDGGVALGGPGAPAGASPELSPDLLKAVAGVLNRWDWVARPTWICPVPSRRNEAVVEALAEGLGKLGKLPVHRALVRTDDGSGARQSDQTNSAHQVANVWGRLAVDPGALPEGAVLDGPVLLVDDRVASRWTVTVAAWLLTESGSGPVLPFALESR